MFGVNAFQCSEREQSEGSVNGRNFSCGIAILLGVAMTATWALSQIEAPVKHIKSPGWFLQGSAPREDMARADAIGRAADTRNPLTACAEDIPKLCPGLSGPGQRSCMSKQPAKLSAVCRDALASAAPPSSLGVPPCVDSTVCSPSGTRGGRNQLQRIEWKQTMGYKFAYPYNLPTGGDGVLGVAFDREGYFWAYQRSPVGRPTLFKFDSNRKIILTVGDDVLGHLDKVHGMTVDGDGNLWIAASNSALVMKVSPNGKLLLTIGERGHRGDWVESKGQRLLWQPLDIAIGPRGDVFIAEGHGDESPNDVDSADPTNNQGAARIIHLNRDGKFVNQWYGDRVGQGHFYSAHTVAIDPKTDELWVGDREEYRFVLFKQSGEFVRTIQMRNLTCAIRFDPHGEPWVSDGMDGQVLRVDRDGNVLGAIGGGQGKAEGQFMESNYMTWDKYGNIYLGDTILPRVTELIAPRK
jgi:sugar lactone lactonase YvrE